MNNDTTAAFSFPAVAHKKVSGAFDGGRITSDVGVVLLSLTEVGSGSRSGFHVVSPIDAPFTRHA
jgi:hypothetical protein